LKAIPDSSTPSSPTVTSPSLAAYFGGVFL
jgi:hypothetical protein